MIKMRLEEKNRSKDSWQEEEESWPREFCLVSSYGQELQTKTLISFCPII
jgi:hypothetical protein